MTLHRTAGFCALALLSSTAAAAADPAQVLEEVTIVGLTPLDLHGPAAGAAQRADAGEIEASNALDITRFMERRMGSAWINDIQGNPLQADLNFRGFTASPLLGTPQGLSVYLDGVRLNQPFGDVVSWDLIPRSAIARLTLLPGANPLFGLNTLGGSAVLVSKDGWNAPGTQLELTGGSWDRRRVEAQTGGSRGAWAWYATANRFEESGWRDFSPSAATQAFAKGSWRDEDTDLYFSLAAADTDLNGNGLQELRMLSADHGSVYTQPDELHNRATLANFAVRERLSDLVLLSANTWYRDIRSIAFNGDINEESLGQALADPVGDCLDEVLEGDDADEACNGLLNRGRTSQHEYGANLQLDLEMPFGARDNDVTLGIGATRSRARFRQSTQYGYLTAERGVAGAEGPGAFADEAAVDLGGTTTTWSFYASDSVAVTKALRAVLAARYDQTRIRNRDALLPGGGPGSLDGDHRYGRVNAALGLHFDATEHTSVFASLGQGSRAPSSIELGCADPDSPCRLPNSMAGDPPLDQVVATSVEAGLRSRASPAFAWSASVFHSVNRDDILFVADDQAGFGYFRNFGRTRRQGVELGIEGRIRALAWGANYTRLDARFRSAETINGEANSSSDAVAPGFDGGIDVEAGDRLPLVPRHVAKAFVEWTLLSTVTLAVDWRYIGASPARGNENGGHQPDGVYFLGPGGSGGHGVLDLGLSFRPRPHIDLFVQVENALDKRYANASQLGATGFDANGVFVSQPFDAPVIDDERPLRFSTFYGPGAPRGVQLGLRYRFD